MASLQDRIRYLRDCYRADSRTGGVLDVFASKVEYLRFLSGPEQVLTGRLNPLPVRREDFEAAARAAAIYRREKSLFYGAFLLVGRSAHPEGSAVEVPRRPRTIRAPLFLWPAELADDPEYPKGYMPLVVHLEEQRINFAALAAMLGDEERALEATDRLLEAWVEPPVPSDAAARLTESLAPFFGSLEAASLRGFPELAASAEVEAAGRRAVRRSTVEVLSAAVVALAAESLETRGVLHDLSTMAGRAESSLPVELLLGDSASAMTLDRARADRSGPQSDTVPAVLSAAQRKALASARRNLLTLLSGPPGTGKTFTLAAVALDQLARGQAVLVASRSRQALDVVADKLESLLGDRAVLLEGGRRQRLKALKGRLEQLLHGAVGTDPAPGIPLGEMEGRLAEVELDLERLEGRIVERAGLEATWGRSEERIRKGRSNWWHAPVHAVRGWRLERRPDYWTLLEEYEALLERRIHRAALLLRASIHRRRVDHLSRHRKQLQRFLSALRARHSSRQDRLFGELDWRVLLAAFPLWTVRFADVHRVVPRVPELFDLVIVDEATQCDMATALPTLLRGRRLVVTGDPKQLRHVSFLSRDRQRSLAEGHGLSPRSAERLDYRERSLLDLVSETVEEQDQAIFLDEHFRSTPEIIRFSNREFYQGSLRIMTHRPETVERRSLFVRRVRGRRRSEGHNPEEAERVLEELVKRLDGEAELPGDRVGSIGVLSPFRDQVEHLGEHLHRTVPLSALERHRIRVGTPYAFQGEERDVMFLSLALDEDSPAGAFRYLERPDVFNVAITRARDLQLVYCSFDPERLDRRTLLGRYLAHAAETPGGTSMQSDPIVDRFLEEVRDALEQRDFRTWAAYPVAGLEIDLMVAKNGRSLGIDLVGHPGAYGDAFELERCRILQRAGLELFPLPFSAWSRCKERCVQAIEDRFSRS